MLKEYHYVSTHKGLENWEIKRLKESGWGLAGVSAKPDSKTLKYTFTRYSGA